MSSSIDSKVMGVGTGAIDSLKENRSSPKKGEVTGGVSFGETLSQQMDNVANKADIAKPSTTEKPILKFSNHALERMNSRGIHFSPEQVTKIEQAMQKATEKGAKESLVLTDDSALIVSLKNNTVVTVMDKNMMKENVFTNIDSTVFV